MVTLPLMVFLDLFKVVRKKKTILPNGGEKWWFTTVECVKNHQKNKPKWLQCPRNPNTLWGSVFEPPFTSPEVRLLRVPFTPTHQVSSVFFCCFRAYTLAPCLHNCFRMSTRNGKGAYAGVFLDWVPTRVPPQGFLLDGHVLGKWWKICLRDSAYATKIYIASARAYARLHGLWNSRSSAYAAL